MTDHPNQFAIGQQVLFSAYTDERWHEGTVHAVSVDNRAIDLTAYGHRDDHDNDCDGFLYVIANSEYNTLPPGERSHASITECLCNMWVVDADPNMAGRWTHTSLITKRSDLQLLWTDTDGAIAIDSSGTPLEETNTIHLCGPGGETAEVDSHDLVKWAATPGMKG